LEISKEARASRWQAWRGHGGKCGGGFSSSWSWKLEREGGSFMKKLRRRRGWKVLHLDEADIFSLVIMGFFRFLMCICEAKAGVFLIV